MKALSVKQPWAGMIAQRIKPIETRVWATDYRGELLICASKKPVFDYKAFQCDHCYQFLTGTLNRSFFICPFCGKQSKTSQIVTKQCGMAICIASLVDCRPMTVDDEPKARCKMYPNAFSWVLDNVRLIEPFPVKGQLGLFEVAIPRLIQSHSVQIGGKIIANVTDFELRL